MFNLEEKIADWRRRMLDAGVKTPNVLDELESHLREDVEQQMHSGVNAQQAFEIAVAQIGQAGPLKREFAKVGGGKWALFRKLKGLFVEPVVPGAFTPGAWQTLELARLEAPRLHHNFVGTEHVLLGLLALENGAVPNVLKRMDVDRASLRKQVEQWISIFPSSKTMTRLPYTPRVKKALRLAAREAKASQQACVGAEHIFLGLLLEGDGVAGRVLRNVGVNIQTARAEILKEPRRNHPGD
jgi:hypothetical protein